VPIRIESCSDPDALSTFGGYINQTMKNPLQYGEGLVNDVFVNMAFICLEKGRFELRIEYKFS
jgi:3'-phosphoadenosine 5'-phosphosulfate (PAPS) 3'-phosphatase